MDWRDISWEQEWQECSFCLLFRYDGKCFYFSVWVVPLRMESWRLKTACYTNDKPVYLIIQIHLVIQSSSTGTYHFILLSYFPSPSTWYWWIIAGLSLSWWAPVEICPPPTLARMSFVCVCVCVCVCVLFSFSPLVIRHRGMPEMVHQ